MLQLPERGSLGTICTCDVMKTLRALVPGVALLLVSTACELITGQVCTTIAIPAVTVDILDSLSGALLPTESIAYARDGGFVDSTVVPPPRPGFVFQPAALAIERPGTYEVTVRSTGYRDWRQSGVRVRDDGCHPRTARLVARLVRAS